MGAALASGWLHAPDPLPSLFVYDKDPARTAAVAAVATPATLVEIAPSIAQLVVGARIIVLALKPQDVQHMLEQLAPRVDAGHTVVSVAAGVSIEQLRQGLGAGPRIFRIMPNLAVGVGAGVVAVAAEPGTPSDAIAALIDLLDCMGTIAELPEGLFDAVTAVAASGPGFMALIMEGLEDGAVRVGLPRGVARPFVQQMVMGTARLLMVEEMSPAQLKDRVSSAAGTTIAGLAMLEDRGVRGALVRAIEAAVERGAQLRG
jgi:pyrroline-5-carboxylate reductase